jgi:decaprenylphospho-beta-D-erythro-pentofuranosid-2-ulose 2-reductase
MTTLILGATSDMAIALAKLLASQGHHLHLAARNTEFLKSLKSDIEIRSGVSVGIYSLDALQFETHASFYNSLQPKPEAVVLFFGYLGDHAKAINDWNECKRILDTNYTGAVSILNVVASDFENRKQGTIVGVSSVAGDRGRMSNYLYGSAKAGLTAYLSGLRNRLFHAGVHVVTIKPGFVRTQMTEGLKLPPMITGEPEQVAKSIFRALRKKQNSIYVLPIWSIIMFVIKSIPESLFKRLKL